tara:strand:- start:26 stop:307 length:282 start_codon:yes stop_codon:yes gene_type:complete
MAKRKTKKVVDLKPTTITQEELKQVQEIISQINQYNLEIGRIEARKHGLLHGLSTTQETLGVIQKQLEKEYGTVNINIETGEINYDVEADKKN